MDDPRIRYVGQQPERLEGVSGAEGGCSFLLTLMLILGAEDDIEKSR
jgi:hypothetical protein